MRDRVTARHVREGKCRWKIVALLMLLSCTAAFSQNMLQMGFPRAELIFASTGYGYSRYADHILSMGDVNRDGYPDIFINAGIRDPFNTWLLFGTKDGTLDRSKYLKLEGYGTLAKGDVNGDGLLDLLVQSNDYTVTMYPGCLTCPFTIDTVPAWRIRAESRYNGDYGNGIVVGDLNGDGKEDIVVSAPFWWTPDSGHPEKGKLFFYFGGSMIFPQPDLTAIYPVSKVQYSENGIKIGDVNGDGYKDLIVGSNNYGGPPFQYIDVFYGRPGFTIDTQHPDQRIGREVIPYSTYYWSLEFLSILDMNNDEVDDLYIGDHYGYIYYGRSSGFPSSPDMVIACPDSIDYAIGGWAHRIGDVNNDGFDDYFLTGFFGSGVGMGFVYLGGSIGIESSTVVAALNPNSGTLLGEEAINVGDLNRDGVNDFATSYINDNGGAWSGFGIFAGRSWWRRTPVDEVPNPGSPLVEAFPNPFHNYTTIVTVGNPSKAKSTTVYDLYGREIRRLTQLEYLGGESQVVWDGRNSLGIIVPPGVYCCIVETNNGFLKGKLIKQ